MADLKIEDLSISIAKAVEMAHQLAQQLAKRGHPTWMEKGTKANFQRLGGGLELARDALNYLKELDIEGKRTMLSIAALSSMGEVLAEFDAVFHRVEAVENARDDGPMESKDLEESETHALLAQLDAVKSRVLLVSAVILYATQIRNRESESVRQRQQGEIRALLHEEITAEETAVLTPDATDRPSPDMAQNAGSPGPPTNLTDYGRIMTKARKETRLIIIGIDFGATSSAAAFALAKSSQQEPRILDGWPESVRQSPDGVPREQQIPSAVYYNGYLDVVGWGEDKYEAVTPCRVHDVLRGLCYPRAGVRRIQGFKSELAPPGDVKLYLPQGKSTADVAADYLWHVRQSACFQIEDQLGVESGREQGSLRYVMTVPASWDEKAHKSLRKIATMAGFWINSDDELALIPGPEAAMLYVDSIEPSAFEIGDNILVVDCGGHLVESVTYEVKSKDPLRLERYTSASMAFCGSAEVTRRFMTIVESKIKRFGLSDHKLSKSRIRPKCRFQFESQIMLELGSPNFQSPASIPRGLWAADVGWEAEFPEADLEEGYLMFSEEEIYSCFDPVIDRTLELIEEQITAVRAHNKGLQTCVLAGGFNKCAYYSERIQSRVAAHRLRIIQPDLSLAFVKGAVLAGLRDVCEVRQPEEDVQGRKVRDLVMEWTTLSQEQMIAL